MPAANPRRHPEPGHGEPSCLLISSLPLLPQEDALTPISTQHLKTGDYGRLASPMRTAHTQVYPDRRWKEALGCPSSQSQHRDPGCVQGHPDEAEGLRSPRVFPGRFLKLTRSQYICLLFEHPLILPRLPPCCHGDHEWDRDLV